MTSVSVRHATWRSVIPCLHCTWNTQNSRMWRSVGINMVDISLCGLRTLCTLWCLLFDWDVQYEDGTKKKLTSPNVWNSICCWPIRWGSCSVHNHMIRGICAQGVELWQFKMLTHLENGSSSVVRGVTRFLWAWTIWRKPTDHLSDGVSDTKKTGRK